VTSRRPAGSTIIPAPLECTVTIEVSGSYPQLTPILEDLGRLFGEQNVRVVGRTVPDTEWDAERAAQFVAELKAPAMVALRHIAAGAPKVGVAYVRAQMARAGLPTTPGTLSSIGFAVRRLGFPPPFTRDGYQRAYHMDIHVARHLLAALDAEEERRRSSGPQRNPPARSPRRPAPRGPR
jgi:hypothetical protein